MKKIAPNLVVALLLIAGLNFSAYSQNVGISTTGATPSVNAILDLNTGNTTGANKYKFGLIIPHVELGALLTTFGMANAATVNDTGMMVYNMNATLHPIGYYYWTGSTWVYSSGTIATANNGLSINGGIAQLGDPTTAVFPTGNQFITSGRVLTQNGLPLIHDLNLNTAATTTTGTFIIQNGNTLPYFYVAPSAIAANGAAVGIGNSAPGSNILNVSTTANTTTTGNGILLTGQAGFTNFAGGAVQITAGAGNGVATGGVVQITGGAGAGAAAGGAVSLTGGIAGASLAGGTASVTGGSGGGGGGAVGGAASLSAGTVGTLGSGGNVTIAASSAGNTGTGTAGTVGITAGNGGGTTSGAGSAGGNVNITAGSAKGTGNNAGGDIILQAGAATGTGITGDVGVGTNNPVSTLDNAGSAGVGIIDIPTQANGFSGNITGFGIGSTYIANPPTLVASTYTLVLPSPSLNPRQIITLVYNGSSLGKINLQTPTANTIQALGTLSTNFSLNAGSVVLQSDGTDWNVTGQTFAVSAPTQLLGVKVFSTAGTVSSQSFDPGTTSIQFKLIGGGGSGGGVASTATLPGTCVLTANEDWSGAGGGAGGYCEGFLNGLTSASTFSGAVGSGGTGGVPTLGGTTCALTYTPPAGANGGSTTLTIVNPAGGVYTASGGTAGGTTERTITANPSIILAGGAGGSASGGAINITGSSGGDCVVTWEGSNQTDEGGSGGGSIYGTGGFGNLTRDPTPIPGNNATGVGAGGAGACVAHGAHGVTANANGGNGAAGIIIIYEY